MNVERIDSQFQDALGGSDGTSEVEMRLSSGVSVIIFIFGCFGIVSSFFWLDSDAGPYSVFFAIYSFFGSLLIMCQGLMLSLTTSIARDSRDTKRMVRRVAAGLVKRAKDNP